MQRPTGAQPPHPGTVSAFGRMPMRNRVRGVARLCGRRPRGHVGIGAGYKSCTRHRGGRKLPQEKKICLCPPLRRTGPAPAPGIRRGLPRRPRRRAGGAGTAHNGCRHASRVGWAETRERQRSSGPAGKNRKKKSPPHRQLASEAERSEPYQSFLSQYRQTHAAESGASSCSACSVYSRI